MDLRSVSLQTHSSSSAVAGHYRSGHFAARARAEHARAILEGRVAAVERRPERENPQASVLPSWSSGMYWLASRPVRTLRPLLCAARSSHHRRRAAGLSSLISEIFSPRGAVFFAGEREDNAYFTVRTGSAELVVGDKRAGVESRSPPVRCARRCPRSSALIWRAQLFRSISAEESAGRSIFSPGALQ